MPLRSTGKKNEAKRLESSDGTVSTPDEILTIPPDLQAPGQFTETDKGLAQPSGLEKLKGIKGVNVDALFAEKIEDYDTRFARLESAVQDLRREFETVKPSIIRLVAIEEDIQDLIVMLSTDVEIPDTPPVLNDPAARDEVEPQSLKQEESDPLKQKNSAQDNSIDEIFDELVTDVVTDIGDTVVPKKSDSQTDQANNETPSSSAVLSHEDSKILAILSNIRVGNHTAFSRIVFDVNRAVSYEAILNTDKTTEKQSVTIEIRDTKWNGNLHKSFPKHPVFSSYTIEEDVSKGAVKVLLSLRKSVLSIDDQILKNPNRVVVDLINKP